MAGELGDERPKALSHGPAKDGQVVGFVTCPNEQVANTISEALVGSGAAACVNIVPGLSSVYRWKGEVCRDQEHLLIVKTDRSRASEVTEILALQHPYDEPELIFLPIESGSEGYLNWMRDTRT